MPLWIVENTDRYVLLSNRISLSNRTYREVVFSDRISLPILDNPQLSTLFTLSTMLNDLFKRPRHLVQQSVQPKLKFKWFKQDLRVVCYKDRVRVYKIEKKRFPQNLLE